MNVSVVKFLCWLASAATTFGLSAYGYVFFKDIEQRKRPYEVEHVQTVLDATFEIEATTQEATDYKDVKRTFHDLNWTGHEAPKPVAVQQQNLEPPKPQHKPVADLLTLQMIRVDTTDPMGSRIYVRYKPGVSDPDGDLGTGDALPAPHSGITVAEIRIDGVEFAFDGGTRPNEVVTAASLDDDTLIVVVGPDGARSPVRTVIPTGGAPKTLNPAQTELVGTNRYRVGTEDAEYLNQNYAQVLTSDIRSRTWIDPKTGRRAGIEIQDVRSGSVAERHGARGGDVIKSINGHPVTSQQEVVKYVKNNADHTTVWEVVVWNMGRERTVFFESPSE